MSFVREMGNVAATLGGAQLLNMAWKTTPQSGASLAKNTIGSVLGYGGNLLVSDKSADEMKEIIRNRAVAMLTSKGLSADEVNQAFEQHYGDEPLKKPGFWRNVGNQLATSIVAGVGAYATSALAGTLGLKILESHDTLLGSVSIINADTIAKKAVVAVGGLLGGYVGNKAWQGPSKAAIEERSLDIVTKILAERRPEMSQVEALQHRDGQRTQGTEVVR
jgi:hypothetical protein